MRLKEVIAQLEQFCPPQFAVSWDNSGLQVGRYNQDISRVCLAVDATSSVIAYAAENGADLLITHHPLLFSGLKRIHDRDFTGKRVIDLIRSDIACYAMHTNFDVMGMADEAADRLQLEDREVLQVTYEDAIANEGIGRVGNLSREMRIKYCCELVKEAFILDNVRLFGDPETKIRRVAIAPGSGADMIPYAIKAGAQLLITGDISHHKGIDAVAEGLSVIDAGHYGIEKIFVSYMKDYFRKKMPDMNIMAASQKEPFIVL